MKKTSPKSQGITLHQLTRMGYTFRWLPKDLVTKETLEELSLLYSTHYGFWSTENPNNKRGRVRLSPNRILEFFTSPNTKLGYATYMNKIIAYAIVVQEDIKNTGLITWITQLVVHEHHRNKGVSKALLFSVWGFTNHYAWGVLTANPYAVRALEKATRRRCSPERIQSSVSVLKQTALRYVSYFKKDMEIELSKENASVNTRFYVNHSDVPIMLADVTSPNIPWKLGQLKEGWEWLAFTFNDQQQISLTPEEIEDMLNVSDQIAKEAYSRMLLNNEHKWAAHTDKEAEWIIEYCNLRANAHVLDFGCGIGRHAIELAKRGIRVTGVDYLQNLIDRAQINAQKNKLGIRLKVADCRTVELGQEFDAVICLYDVVGSFADQEDNFAILKNITKHLRIGGTALISVMNYTRTEQLAKHTFSLSKEPDRLLTLKPSRGMELNGEVFDPQFYMIDKETRIVYRREQFTEGNSLPTELIVRDRRYLRSEIQRLCIDAGMKVKWGKFVRSGNWKNVTSANEAKEILICCEKK